jgi:hypothetical protein
MLLEMMSIISNTYLPCKQNIYFFKLWLDLSGFIIACIKGNNCKITIDINREDTYLMSEIVVLSIFFYCVLH